MANPSSILRRAIRTTPGVKWARQESLPPGSGRLAAEKKPPAWRHLRAFALPIRKPRPALRAICLFCTLNLDPPEVVLRVQREDSGRPLPATHPSRSSEVFWQRGP